MAFPQFSDKLGQLGRIPAQRPGIAAEAEYRRYLLSRIMQIVQTDFPATTWQIFRQVVIEGRRGWKWLVNSA